MRFTKGFFFGVGLAGLAILLVEAVLEVAELDVVLVGAVLGGVVLDLLLVEVVLEAEAAGPSSDGSGSTVIGMLGVPGGNTVPVMLGFGGILSLMAFFSCSVSMESSTAGAAIGINPIAIDVMIGIVG